MEIEQAPTVFSKEIQEILNKERESRLNNDYNESNRLLPEIVILSVILGSIIDQNRFRIQRIRQAQ